MQAVAKVLTVSLNFDIMFNLLGFWFMDNKKTIFHELHQLMPWVSSMVTTYTSFSHYTVVKGRKQSKVDEKQEYLDNSF